MRDYILRTTVPILVGVIVGQATRIGLDLPSGAVTEIVTPGIALGYATGARLVERVRPRLGRILLSLGLAASSPVYVRE
ncbi:hypothetical protein [Actinomadura harenae]|uniref:Uncharacterized protein n=1 Tax=Actinomadura harenae TaxID=2483351 RepID=A0A3M2LY12_9ACTN|nr:hypothetical protein [Actinomadura harenae]RMI39868.1 hypothetical protein EBO15_28280 [Actinomadura harenae]